MIILLLMLKSTHTLSTAFQVFISTWNMLSIKLAGRFNRNTAMAAQLLWSVQLCTLVYWKSTSSLTLNDAHIFSAPNFVELLTSLLIQIWKPPQMPGLAPTPLSTSSALRPPALAPDAPVHARTPAPSRAPAPIARSTINRNMN